MCNLQNFMATRQETLTDYESRFLISDLCRMLEEYLEPNQVQEVYNAYLFGAEAHEGQMRISGEPYIYHPVEVAHILAEMRMDAESIIASVAVFSAIPWLLAPEQERASAPAAPGPASRQPWIAQFRMPESSTSS